MLSVSPYLWSCPITVDIVVAVGSPLGSPLSWGVWCIWRSLADRRLSVMLSGRRALCWLGAHFEGLSQDSGNSSASALELQKSFRLSPSLLFIMYIVLVMNWNQLATPGDFVSFAAVQKNVKACIYQPIWGFFWLQTFLLLDFIHWICEDFWDKNYMRSKMIIWL